MDDDHHFTPVAAAVSPTPLTSGAKLRAARERKRLSERELADQTRLPLATILALEADDFSALVEPVYVKGYYRKCATALGLEPNELINAYRPPQPRRSLGDTRVPLSLSSEGDETASSRDNRLPVMLATLVVIAGIVVWYVYDQRRARALVQAVPADVAELGRTTAAAPPVNDGVSLRTVVPLDASTSSAAAAVPETTPIPNAPELRSSAEPVAAAAVVEAVPASPATPVPSPAVAVGKAALQLRVSANSWTRIDDADGKVLVNRVLTAGETLNLEGSPPITVVLGNGPGVSLSFNGDAIDFSAYVTTTATARFRLPLGSD